MSTTLTPADASAAAAAIRGGRSTQAKGQIIHVAPSGNAGLLDVAAVAEMLVCSTRHVYRLSDAGKMPGPVKLGALVRWNRAVVESWISQGCPSVRSMKGAGK